MPPGISMHDKMNRAAERLSAIEVRGGGLEALLSSVRVAALACPFPRPKMIKSAWSGENKRMPLSSGWFRGGADVSTSPDELVARTGASERGAEEASAHGSARGTKAGRFPDAHAPRKRSPPGVATRPTGAR